MSDYVMRALTGWSSDQLAAWRKSLRVPVGRIREAQERARLAALRAVLPGEVVDTAAGNIIADESGPVGESLFVRVEQLSPAEQRHYRALEADPTLSPEQRSKAMRGSKSAERAELSGLCDAATARAQGREQGRLFTDAELDESIPERLKLPAH